MLLMMLMIAASSRVLLLIANRRASYSIACSPVVSIQLPSTLFCSARPSLAQMDLVCVSHRKSVDDEKSMRPKGGVLFI